jgi:hypothetical protein
MGLLKRAASLCFIVQQTVENPNQYKLKKSGAEQSSQSIKSEGLLKKTLSLLNDGFFYTKESPFWKLKNQQQHTPRPLHKDYKAELDQFRESIEQIDVGITYPYYLFEKIKKTLNLYDAALFLLNRFHNCYMPWVLSGAAVRNHDHMLLTDPSPELTAILGPGLPYIAEENSPFYFPPIDHSLSPLLVAPFIYNEKLIALLIIFNADKNIYDLGKLTDFLGHICRLTAPNIFAQREKILSNYTHLDSEKWRNKKSSILSLYQECKSEGVALFLMVTSLKNMLKIIKEKNNFINSQCFFEDILFLMNSLLNGIGLAYQVKEKKIIIFYKGYHSLDPRLLLHQIFLQIKNLYGVLAEDWPISIPDKPEILEEEEKNIENILEDYLPAE